MTTPATPSGAVTAPHWSQTFVTGVLQLCRENKGAQSDLRGGLARPIERSPRMQRHVVRLLPKKYSVEQKRACYAVAALIADRPRQARDAHNETQEETESADTATDQPDPVASGDTTRRPRRNLGCVLAEGVLGKAISEGSAESDLHLFTRQRAESVHRRLPPLLRQLQNGGVAVDWAVLLQDMAWWDRGRDEVATRWLESFYRTMYATKSADDADAGSSPMNTTHDDLENN